MGDFVSYTDSKNVANSLNWMFDENVDQTFRKVEALRELFPNFLNPNSSPSPLERRRQSLRFAALLLMDETSFGSGKYPAKKFRKWLRYLTWLGQEQGGILRKDGANYPGTAASLITEVILLAMPPKAKAPRKIVFSYTAQAPVTVLANTKSDPMTIEVQSIKENNSGVDGNSDDEDDV